MAATKKGFVVKSKREGGFLDVEEEFKLGLGSVRFTRELGRKRILLSSRIYESLPRSSIVIPVTESPPPIKSSLKKQRSRDILSLSSEKFPLESLPQELLIRVICSVDHEDLKSLNIVSKSIREASLIAKELHFAYTTPKKIRAFRNQLDLEDPSHQMEDIEPSNAPIHHRWTKAKRKELLSNVSMALFN